MASSAPVTNDIPIFDTKTFFQISEDDKKEWKIIHKLQCKTIYKSMCNEDEAMQRALTIGYKNDYPFIQYCADLYMRDALEYQLLNKRVLTITEWIGKSQFCIDLKDKTKFSVNMMENGLKSYFKRVAPKLQSMPNYKIEDPIEDISQYIFFAMQWVKVLARLKMDNKLLVCPFQVDFGIIMNSAITGDDNDEDSTSEDDEDEGDDADEDVKSNDIDFFGNIEQRVCPYFLSDQIDKQTNYEFMNLFTDFKNTKMKQKYPKVYNQYPRGHRVCVIIDRRDKENDKIIFYEPSECNLLPSDGNPTVPLFYFNTSMTSVIPKEETNDNDDDDDKEQFFETNETITCQCECNGQFMLFSFHVTAVDQIRCYLFSQKQMYRFMPEDMLKVLPIFFKESWNDESDAQTVINRFQELKVEDYQFNILYEKYHGSLQNDSQQQ